MSDPSTGMAAFGSAIAPPPPQQFQGLRPVAPNVYMTDFNDQDVQQYEFPLYSGKTGVTDRIYLLSPGDIVRGRTHFHQKLKGGIICNSQYTLSADRKTETLTQEANCCKWLPSSQIRFGALLMHYGTDVRGGLVMPFTFQLKLWRFGVDKYTKIRAINADFPVAKFDLQLTCTDDNYQKIDIMHKPESIFLHPNFPADEKARVLAWVQASIPKLAKELGRKFESDQDLWKHLQENGVVIQPANVPAMVGGAGPVANPFGAPGPVGPQDAPTANFTDIIAQATSSTTGPQQPLPGNGSGFTPTVQPTQPAVPAAPQNPFGTS